METAHSKPYYAILFILAAAVLGGATSTFSKLALREIPPIPFTLLRFVLGALILLPFIIKNRGARPKNLKKIILVSLLSAVNIIFFIFGLQKTTATVAQMLHASVPLLAAIFSFFLLKEKFTGQKIGGVLIGFFGVLLIILLPALEKQLDFRGGLWGNTIIFIGATSFALYSVLSKQFQTEYSPLQITWFFVMTTLATQIVLLPFGAAPSTDWWRHLSATTIFALLYVGTISTGIFYLIYQYAIKHATPVAASMILYLQPVFAFLWASILLQEKITTGFIVGALLALSGVALVTNFGKPKTTLAE